LLVINRVFFGRLTEKLAQLPPVLWREHIPAFILIALIFTFGLQPSWVVHWSEVQAVALLTGS
jgi:NAD(P)H-quinone oxidoreductase subunit 4